MKVSDSGRLNRALEKLEPLQSSNRDRKTIAVSMWNPEFKTSSDAKSEALSQAFENARAKAMRLAATMKCTLGNPTQVEEGGWESRGSGFSPYQGIVMAAGPACDAEPELPRPTRTLLVSCRVRFAILDKET